MVNKAPILSIISKKICIGIELQVILLFDILASLDGSMGFLLPISEKVYRRLLMLQNALVTQVPHVAGLNPRAYRSVIHVLAVSGGKALTSW